MNQHIKLSDPRRGLWDAIYQEGDAGEDGARRERAQKAARKDQRKQSFKTFYGQKTGEVEVTWEVGSIGSPQPIGLKVTRADGEWQQSAVSARLMSIWKKAGIVAAFTYISLVYFLDAHGRDRVSLGVAVATALIAVGASLWFWVVAPRQEGIGYRGVFPDDPGVVAGVKLAAWGAIGKYRRRPRGTVPRPEDLKMRIDAGALRIPSLLTPALMYHKPVEKAGELVSLAEKCEEAMYKAKRALEVKPLPQLSTYEPTDDELEAAVEIERLARDDDASVARDWDPYDPTQREGTRE